MQISSQQVSNDGSIIEQATLELVQGLEALLKKDGVPEHAWLLTPEKPPHNGWFDWGFSQRDFRDTSNYENKPDELVSKTFYSFDIMRAAYEIAKSLYDHKLILKDSYPGITKAIDLNDAAFKRANAQGLKSLWYLLYYFDSVTSAWVPIHIVDERSYAVARLFEAFYEKIAPLNFPLKEAFLGGILPTTIIPGFSTKDFGAPRLPKLKAAIQKYKTTFEGTQQAIDREKVVEARKADFLARIQSKMGVKKSNGTVDAASLSSKELFAFRKKHEEARQTALNNIEKCKQAKEKLTKAENADQREVVFNEVVSVLDLSPSRAKNSGRGGFFGTGLGAWFTSAARGVDTKYVLSAIEAKIVAEQKQVESITGEMSKIAKSTDETQPEAFGNLQTQLRSWKKNSGRFFRPVEFAGSNFWSWGGFKQWASGIVQRAIARWWHGTSKGAPTIVREQSIDEMVIKLRELLAKVSAETAGKEGVAATPLSSDTLRDLGGKVANLVYKLQDALDSENIKGTWRAKAVSNLIASAQEFLQWVSLKQTCSSEQPSKTFLQVAGLATEPKVSPALGAMPKVAANGNTLQGLEVCMLDRGRKALINDLLLSKFPKGLIHLASEYRIQKQKVGMELRYNAANKNAVPKVEQVLQELTDVGVISCSKNEREGSYTIEICDLQKLQNYKAQFIDIVTPETLAATINSLMVEGGYGPQLAHDKLMEFPEQAAFTLRR